jgi:hypothetical protein
LTNSTPIIAAIITLCGTALLAPVVNRILTWIFEYRANLQVEVRVFEYRQPAFLNDEVELLRKSLDWKDPRLESLRKSTGLSSCVHLVFHNSSKKRINEITLMITFGRGFYQIETANSKEWFDNTTRIKIGDLQPAHKSEVWLWVDQNLFTRWGRPQERFVVSANELHKTYFRYPSPEYLEKTYAFIPRWVTRVWWVVAWLLGMIAATAVNVFLRYLAY